MCSDSVERGFNVVNEIMTEICDSKIIELLSKNEMSRVLKKVPI